MHQGIMLVYDMTSIRSFENITSWLENIYKNAPEETKIMLLGNKCDVPDQRKVTFGEAKEVLFKTKLHFAYKKNYFIPTKLDGQKIWN